MSEAEDNKKLESWILSLLDEQHGIGVGIARDGEVKTPLTFARMGPKTADRDFVQEYVRLLAAAIDELPGDKHGIELAELGTSEHADCENLAGEVVNAFITDQRCYRLNLTIVEQS